MFGPIVDDDIPFVEWIVIVWSERIMMELIESILRLPDDMVAVPIVSAATGQLSAPVTILSNPNFVSHATVKSAFVFSPETQKTSQNILN